MWTPRKWWPCRHIAPTLEILWEQQTLSYFMVLFSFFPTMVTRGRQRLCSHIDLSQLWERYEWWPCRHIARTLEILWEQCEDMGDVAILISSNYGAPA